VSTTTKLIPQEEEERIGNESRGKKAAVWIPQLTNGTAPQRQKMATRIQTRVKRRLLVVNRHKESEREKKKKPFPSSFSSSTFQCPKKATI
jgi:hypothetical protein